MKEQVPQTIPFPDGQQPPDTLQAVQEPTQEKKSNKWLVTGLVIFALAALGIAGVFAYQNYQLKERAGRPQLTPTPTINFLTPAPAATRDTSLSEYVELFEMPKYEVILKICGENWEGTETHPHEEECLKFYGYGKVEKTIDGKTSNNNDNDDQEKKDKIANEVISIYQELQQEKFKNWLLKPKAPEVGGVMETIITYAKSKGVKPVSSQYLQTNYAWGTDYSDESKRLREIFEKLKSYTPK